MSDNSAIEWTDATWNPTTGCTKVSAGCDECYAERIALRFGRSFDLELHPDRVEKPLTWQRPQRVFVNSVSNLFHRDVPWGFVDQVFGIMEAAKHHTYQVLTKRSSTMRDYLRSMYAGRECPAHIWCSVSVEDRKALARVRHLQESPASVRFLSCEPLVAPLGLSAGQLRGFRLGGRRGRVRAGRPSDVTGLGQGCAGTVPATWRRILLQAAGRPHPEGGR